MSQAVVIFFSSVNVLNVASRLFYLPLPALRRCRQVMSEGQRKALYFFPESQSPSDYRKQITAALQEWLFHYYREREYLYRYLYAQVSISPA